MVQTVFSICCGFSLPIQSSRRYPVYVKNPHYMGPRIIYTIPLKKVDHMRKVEAVLPTALIVFLTGCCCCLPLPLPDATLPQGTWELALTSPNVGALREAVVSTGNPIFDIRTHSIGTPELLIVLPEYRAMD